MNALDRIIAWVSPSLGLKRAQLRVQARAYDSASYGRTAGKNWAVNGASSGTEHLAAAKVLRERSRDLRRNNPHVARVMSSLPSHVTGIGIRAVLTSDRPAIQKRIRTDWEDWTNSTSIDFDGMKTFAGIQRLAFQAMLESGECFIRKIIAPKYNRLNLQLQILEADHLDSSKDGYATTDGGYFRQGIEYNESGRRVAYWMFRHHPGESRYNQDLTSVRIPADEIIHLFEQDRPGAQRGFPLGTSSMNDIRNHKQFTDAELMRAKVAACFAGFVTKLDNGAPTLDDGVAIETIEPGAIEYLRPGETMTMATPPPANGFEAYNGTMLRNISAGYEVTYAQMTNDLSKVNFSSGRMGHIESSKRFEVWQELVCIPVMCQRIFDWFLDAAILAGALRPGTQVKASWTAPGREFVDPMKEINALVNKVRAGFISWQEAVRTLGYNPEEIARELQEDKALFDKAGLMPYADPRYDTNRQIADGSPSAQNTDNGGE